MSGCRSVTAAQRPTGATALPQNVRRVRRAFSPQLGGNASCFCPVWNAPAQRSRPIAGCAADDRGGREPQHSPSLAAGSPPTSDRIGCYPAGTAEPGKRKQARSQPLDWDLALGLPWCSLFVRGMGNYSHAVVSFLGFSGPDGYPARRGRTPTSEQVGQSLQAAREEATPPMGAETDSNGRSSRPNT